MMAVFTYLGMAAAALIALFVLVLLKEIAGNIYGGIKGVYRFHAILVRDGKKPVSHWSRIRQGLKCWSGGNRYDGDCGKYWQYGAMRIPVDGRSKIGRDRFYPG